MNAKISKMWALLFFALALIPAMVFADDAMNATSLTAGAINGLVQVASTSTSWTGFLHTIEAVGIGLLLSPVKQNLIEHFVAPFVPVYIRVFLPIVFGGILTAIGTKAAVLLGIDPKDAVQVSLAFGAAATGGTYAFNGSSLAAVKPE